MRHSSASIIPAMYERIERERLSWTLLLPGVITDFMNNPAAPGQRSVEPALRHRLRQHDAERRREADGDLRHRFLRRLRAERVELSARARLFRPRRSAVAAQTTLAVDGGPCRRRRHERDACRPAGRMRGAGPSIMSGYLDDDEANAEVFKGGWLHNGDLLRREEDGTLTFVDRKKYLIKTGGENVYPAEIEAVPQPTSGRSRSVCVRRTGRALGRDDKGCGRPPPGPVGRQRRNPPLVSRAARRLIKRPRYLQFMRSDECPAAPPASFNAMSWHVCR